MPPKFMVVGGYGRALEENVLSIRKSKQHSIVFAVPWEIIASHERQAIRNHSQTLERLSERGGLSRCEAVAILEDRPWHRMKEPTANARLLQLIAGAHPATPADDFANLPRLFSLGQRVRKKSGASWQGPIVGFYSTPLTPIGYAVMSEREPGSVQIYPESALEKVDD